MRFFERFNRGARVTRVTMPTALYLATRKILLKLLRIEIENYSHHHDNGNVSNQTSMGIDLFESHYYSLFCIETHESVPDCI
jgi:hypothetical protein